MGDASSHWINVRNKPAFLHGLMVALGDSARISLEGDLTRCRFADELVVAHDETDVLKRGTSFPKQDFVVLRLEQDTVAPIFEQVMAAGVKRAIVHVQIEKDGVIELGAYDNFHPECVVTRPGIPETLLADMHAKGIVRSFTVATPPASR